VNPLHSGFWLGVLVSAVCGAIIGMERQLRGKPAGIRTSIMICMGTMVFVRLGTIVYDGAGDTTRVMGQVVTGIGFIGAGLMLAREGLVRGVTSAAVIWMLAAIGCLVGFGMYGTSVALSFLVVVILYGVQVLERTVFNLRRGDYASESQEGDGTDVGGNG
jgi:putative Mg2+ transporter-C (MgtC) family protein